MNWISIGGDFQNKKNSIIFQGGYQQVDNAISNLENVPSKCGILLFNERFLNGTMEANIEFVSLNQFDEVEFVFNYKNERDFMCAGITNSQAKYELKKFKEQWEYLRLSGYFEALPHKKFNLKVIILGSNVDLYIDNIKVFSHTVSDSLIFSNVGLWVRSGSSVIIKDLKFEYKKPTAFIISQFGNDYDILYNDVIKPICQNSNYDTIRADEVATCSAILEDIVSSIKNASVIIADITPDNPNVFYELGYAHAINKPTILLCEKSSRTKLPFDISGFRTIFYDNTIGGKKKVEEKLNEYLHNII